MSTSTLLTLLGAVLDLIERHLNNEGHDDAPADNLVAISRQLQRLAACQLRLAQAAQARAARKPRARKQAP